MAGAEVVMRGAAALEKRIEEIRLKVAANKDRAARSAANVVRRAIRMEARKLRGSGRVVGTTKTGRDRVKHDLESSVRVRRLASGDYRVAPETPLAHLVIRGVRGHGLISGKAMPIMTSGGLIFRNYTTRHTTPRPFVSDAFTELTRVEAIAAAKVAMSGGPEASDT